MLQWEYRDFSVPGEGQVRGTLLWSLLSSARLACDIIQKFRNVLFAQSSNNTRTPTDRSACSIYRRNAECGVALVQPSWPEQDPSPLGGNGRDAAASSIPGGAAPFKHGVGGYWDLRGAGAAVRVQEGSNCVCQQVTQQGRGLWHRGCACLVTLGDEWAPLRAWWYPSAEPGHSTLLLLLTHLEPSSRSLKASK